MPAQASKPQPPERPAGERPSFEHLHLWQITPIRDAFWIGLIILVILFTYWLRSIFTPVLIALLLAYIFNPLICYFEEKWRLPRTAVIGGLLGMLTLVLGGLVWWLGPLLVEQITQLVRSIPGYFAEITDYLRERGIDIAASPTRPPTATALPPPQTLPAPELAAPQALAPEPAPLPIPLPENPGAVLRGLIVATSRAFGFIGTVISTTVYVLVSLGLIAVYFFFFAWHFEPMLRRLRENIPSRQRRRAFEIFRQMDVAVSGFFRGRLIVAVIMTAIFTIGWWLAGVPYWFLLGVVSGALNVIPYAVTIVWPLAILLKWLEIGTPTAELPWVDVLVWPTAVYVAAQILDNWIITPIVQSQAVNLSAVTIIIVVLVGGSIGGLYGLLLAVPAAACLKIVGKEVIVPHLKAWASQA